MGWVGRFVCRLGWAWAAPRRAHRAREAVEASREHAGRLQPMVAASTLPAFVGKLRSRTLRLV